MILKHEDLNRADYLILTTLYAAECRDYFHSMTINEIIAANTDENGQHSLGARMTIYKRLQKLVEKGYLQKGIMDNHADSFFALDKTVKLFEEK